MLKVADNKCIIDFRAVFMAYSKLTNMQASLPKKKGFSLICPNCSAKELLFTSNKTKQACPKTASGLGVNDQYQ